MENSNQENRELMNNERAEEKGFFSRLMSAVLDQCIVVACSFAVLLALDGCSRIFGYYITERVEVFFILYVLTNIVYPTIMQGTRLKDTVGNRLFR